MNPEKLTAWLKKDGWLLAALSGCVLLCLWIGTGTDSEEARISRVLSAMEGAGAVEVAIYCEDSIPCGAVVIAEGAQDVAVRLRLTDAVGTLLGLEPGRVAVYPGNGGRSNEIR